MNYVEYLSIGGVGIQHPPTYVITERLGRPFVYGDPAMARENDSVTYLSFWLGAEAESI